MSQDKNQGTVATPYGRLRHCKQPPPINPHKTALAFSDCMLDTHHCFFELVAAMPSRAISERLNRFIRQEGRGSRLKAYLPLGWLLMNDTSLNMLKQKVVIRVGTAGPPRCRQAWTRPTKQPICTIPNEISEQRASPADNGHRGAPVPCTMCWSRKRGWETCRQKHANAVSASFDNV